MMAALAFVSSNTFASFPCSARREAGKKSVNRRPGEMGWTPEIQVGTGVVVSYYTETVLQARKRPSLC